MAFCGSGSIRDHKPFPPKGMWILSWLALRVAAVAAWCITCTASRTLSPLEGYPLKNDQIPSFGEPKSESSRVNPPGYPVY